MLECEIEQKNAWEEFLECAKKQCSFTEFQNWLSPIQVVQATPDEIILEVPNIFVQEYLMDNYKKDLLQFLPVSNSGEPAVEFVIKVPIKKKEIQKKTVHEKKAGTKEYHSLYTFDNYIEGPSNQFVKSAAMGVASKPGKSFNPLFIHGGVGLGKTHLLHGIGHYVQRYQKNIRIHCVTTETFINTLVDNLRNKSVDKMKRFYRNLDVLLVDDIQFLQNRTNFEEEFCNTFEALINQHKQIVITSDKPPSELKLSERMTARMEWGLVAHVGTPDLETRVAIIQHKAEQKKVALPTDVAFYISERLYQNIRQIEGAINRLCAYSNLMKIELTIDLAERVLEQLVPKCIQKKITIDQILKTVGTVFEIKVSDMKGSSRLKKIAFARQVAMFLAKELLSDSLSKIASSFGGKTHSTLLHAWKKVQKELENNLDLKSRLDMIKKQLT